MAIKGVSANVEIQTRDILDKIPMTGQRGFSLISYALKTIVLGERPKHSIKVPDAILERVNQVKAFLSGVKEWLPMEKEKRKLPSYRRKVMKERGKFTQAIIDAVNGKLKELAALNPIQRRKVIQQDREKLINLAKEKEKVLAQRAMLEKKLQENIRALREAPKQDAQDDPDGLDRIEFRIQLTDRMRGESLSLLEFSNVSHMVDMDKYPEVQARQLKDHIHLAKWLSSAAIYELIMGDKLIFNGLHQRLLTNPTDGEMRRLSTLSPFIMKGWISVEGALECYLDEQCYNLLDDMQFQGRIATSDFRAQERDLLELMGIAVPKEVQLENRV